MEIAYDILENCVNAARMAPNAGNRQTLEYVIIDEKEILEDVYQTVGDLMWVKIPKDGWPAGPRPTAYILVLINKDKEAETQQRERNRGFDVGFASMSITLVAEEAGLGTCSIIQFKRGKLANILNLPPKYILSLLIMLGYPDEKPVTEDATDSVRRYMDDQGLRHIPKRPLTEVLHRNSYPW
jgi:nitroreductase